MINTLKRYIIKKIYRKFIELDKPLVSSNFKKFSFLKDDPKYSLKSFGNKNKKKIFYVIKINEMGGGLFSNVLFVLNHLKIVDKFGFIPIVDMKNFQLISIF